jgi:hypothetical protein
MPQIHKDTMADSHMKSLLELCPLSAETVLSAVQVKHRHGTLASTMHIRQ